MTTERFNEIVFDILCQSTGGFAAFGDFDSRTVERWSNGRMQVPDRVGEWLEKLAALVEANPPPAKPPVRVYTEARDL
jgi:hypothetical protein